MRQAASSGDRSAGDAVERPEFDLLIEKNADGIVVIDEAGIVLFANPAAEQMFGRPLTQLVGSPIGVPITAREATEISLLRPGGDTIEAEMRIVETIWRGRPALLASLRDITTRRLAEERLRQSQKMEAVGRLTAGIAHDFNNLLTVAMGNLELLHSAPATESRSRRLIGATLSALTRAERLTGQLLAFSRKQHLEPAALDVNQVLIGMEDLLRRAIGLRIEMSYTLTSRLPPALADRNQLETALLNIAANARDAMPNGGRFGIETGLAVLDQAYVREHPDIVPGQYLTIIATDTGEGMPPNVLRRCFEPFFSTKEPGKGTGLGLAMVYGFVRQSGGHVAIESRPEHGTRISIYLPFAGRDYAPAHVPVEEPEPATAGSETVLVVEDDDAVRALARAMLEDIGYGVVEANSADAALKILETQADIDVVFSDVVMPGQTSGIDLARRLIEQRPELPVVLTSGYSSHYSDPDGILSLVQFLRKPYHQAELSAQLRKALGSPARIG
jgi:signal transduction histidine kinase